MSMRELSENVNNGLAMCILFYTDFFAFEIDLLRGVPLNYSSTTYV